MLALKKNKIIKNLHLSVKKDYGKNVFPINKSIPPFVPNEKPYFGYKGVILYNNIEGRIQCSICGLWYKALMGRHLEKDHRRGFWEGKTAEDYRELFGHLRKTALVSIETRENCKEASKKFEKYRYIAGKGHKYWGRKGQKRTTRNCPEMANKYGTCEAQLIYRILLAKKQLGRRPRYEDISFRNAIVRVFGTWKNALRVAGLI